MHSDFISRILCNELNVRAYTVSSLDTAHELTTLHGTTPPATLEFARTITAAALLSATLKPDSKQSVQVKFSGSGPVKEIHVQADASGSIRGYVANPFVDMPDCGTKMNFGSIIGSGFLTIIKDIGLKEPYRSITPIRSNDVASEIAYYLTVSEQIPSAIIIAAKFNASMQLSASGGILVQVFPNTDIAIIEMLEKRILEKKTSLGDMLERGEDIHLYLNEIFDGKAWTILHTAHLRHNCRCSKEILRVIIRGFALDELEDMLAKDGKAEIECSFCKKKYLFTAEELREIIKEKISAPPND